MPTLGDFLYDRMDEPGEVSLYGLGISATRTENEDELDALADDLSDHCAVTTYRVGDMDTDRVDIDQDVSEIAYDSPSLLIVPDTYGFTAASLDPVDRYQRFVDLTGENLRGTLHTDLQNDLDRDAVPESYSDGDVLAWELDRNNADGTTYVINDDKLLYLE